MGGRVGGGAKEARATITSAGGSEVIPLQGVHPTPHPNTAVGRGGSPVTAIVQQPRCVPLNVCMPLNGISGMGPSATCHRGRGQGAQSSFKLHQFVDSSWIRYVQSGYDTWPLSVIKQSSWQGGGGVLRPPRLLCLGVPCQLFQALSGPKCFLAGYLLTRLEKRAEGALEGAFCPTLHLCSHLSPVQFSRTATVEVCPVPNFSDHQGDSYPPPPTGEGTWEQGGGRGYKCCGVPARVVLLHSTQHCKF